MRSEGRASEAAWPSVFVRFPDSFTGAGARFDPPKWLVAGDVVEVSVPELGTLRNTVADAFPEGADHQVPEPQ